MSKTERSNQPIEVFYSYSHRDEDLRNKLEKHLSILKRQGVISGWHDRKISAGTEWEGQITEHLESAQIILLLVSADFVASDYCYDVEMKRALERHASGEARVIPVILRDVDWRGAPFGHLQALPKDAKPVTSWHPRDKAYTDIARGIRVAIEEMSNVSVSQSSSARAFEAGSTRPAAESPTTNLESKGRTDSNIGIVEEVHLDDLILKPPERAFLEMLIAFLRDPDLPHHKARNLGLLPKEIRVPSLILLIGPPGTGKTTIAKMIATESNLPFFMVSPVDLVSAYRGESLMKVKRLFDEWRANAPCIVFWDEIESFASERNQSREDSPIYQILTETNEIFYAEKSPLIIFATNAPEILDPALRRRLTTILISFPDSAGYEALVKKFFPTNLLESELTLPRLAEMFKNHSHWDVKSCADYCKIELLHGGSTTITAGMIERWLTLNPVDEKNVQRWRQMEKEYRRS